MALTATPLGLYFPNGGLTRFPSISTATTLNTATDQSVMIGHVYWEGRASSKTISSAGGQIKWLPGASITFANGGTTVDVGIQDVDAVSGPPVRGDGTFDVKGTLTGGVSTITASTLNTVSMSTGSKTIAHGDLVAVVLNMTARAGADSIQTTGNVGPSPSGLNARPGMTQFKSSSWTANGGVPNVFLVADDGTLGVFNSTTPITTASSESYGSSTNPNERGFIFQLPWDCKIDSIFTTLSNVSGNASDATIAIYSDPTGTPAVVSGTSVTILGENYDRTGSNLFLEVLLASEVSLTANTDYCLAVKATGSTSVSLANYTLQDTNLRKFITGGTTLKKATRNGGSGAFTAESPAVTMYQLGIRISEFNDTSAGAGGSVGVIGS